MTSCAVSASSFIWCMLPTAVDCHKIIFLAVSAGDGQRGATLRIKGPAAGCSRRTTESELTVAIVCAYIVFVRLCTRVLCVWCVLSLRSCVCVFVSVCRCLCVCMQSTENAVDSVVKSAAKVGRNGGTIAVKVLPFLF